MLASDGTQRHEHRDGRLLRQPPDDERQRERLRRQPPEAERRRWQLPPATASEDDDIIGSGASRVSFNEDHLRYGGFRGVHRFGGLRVILQRRPSMIMFYAYYLYYLYILLRIFMMMNTTSLM
jgi:hypothetical protein